MIGDYELLKISWSLNIKGFVSEEKDFKLYFVFYRNTANAEKLKWEKYDLFV